MSFDLDDTIAAIATASGGSCRGMIRTSGRATLSIVGSCFTTNANQPLGANRRPQIIRGHISIRSSNLGPERVPCDLFLWPTERSYTRQTIAELHTLGSPPVLQAALETLCRAGARVAEPGEFTL